MSSYIDCPVCGNKIEYRIGYESIGMVYQRAYCDRCKYILYQDYCKPIEGVAEDSGFVNVAKEKGFEIIPMELFHCIG